MPQGRATPTCLQSKQCFATARESTILLTSTARSCQRLASGLTGRATMCERITRSRDRLRQWSGLVSGLRRRR